MRSAHHRLWHHHVHLHNHHYNHYKNHNNFKMHYYNLYENHNSLKRHNYHNNKYHKKRSAPVAGGTKVLTPLKNKYHFNPINNNDYNNHRTARVFH